MRTLVVTVLNEITDAQREREREFSITEGVASICSVVITNTQYVYSWLTAEAISVLVPRYFSLISLLPKCAMVVRISVYFVGVTR